MSDYCSIIEKSVSFKTNIELITFQVYEHNRRRKKRHFHQFWG